MDVPCADRTWVRSLTHERGYNPLEIRVAIDAVAKYILYFQLRTAIRRAYRQRIKCDFESTSEDLQGRSLTVFGDKGHVTVMSINSNRTPSEWQKIESTEHDSVYKHKRPFDLFDTYAIDTQQVLFWEDYCYKIGRRRDTSHRTKRVFELIEIDALKGKVILDVGCGMGEIAVFLAMMGATVHAFDISPVGVSVGKKMAMVNRVTERCHFSAQNASHISYPDEFFDIVLFHEVLHHAIKYPNVRGNRSGG